MKRSILITGIAVSIVGLTAFGYSLNNNNAEVKCCEPVTTCCASSADTSGISFLNIEAPKAEVITMKKDLWYAVLGKQEQTYRQDEKYVSYTTQSKLKNVEVIGDIIPNYPNNWISDYISMEIWAIINGEKVSASSLDDVLTNEQKSIILSVDLNAEHLNVKVNFYSENAVTGKAEPKEMDFIVNLVPEIEAEYIGGYEQMISYLRGNSLDNILDRNIEQFPMTALTFTVDKNGKTRDVIIKKTSSDTMVDELLIDLIKNMPAWTPAVNSEAGRVEQQFEFTVGASNGC